MGFAWRRKSFRNKSSCPENSRCIRASLWANNTGPVSRNGGKSEESISRTVNSSCALELPLVVALFGKLLLSSSLLHRECVLRLPVRDGGLFRSFCLVADKSLGFIHRPCYTQFS